MRVFVAVDVDEPARRSIGEEQRRIARTIGQDESRSHGPKWIAPDLLHLTLAFLGHVPEERVPALTTRLGEPFSMAPFTITCEGLGVFPPRGAPQVVWLGIADGAQQLTALQRGVAARIADCGLALEARPFHAHLTIGRWRSARPSDARRVLAAAGRHDAAGRHGAVARFAVDHVALFQSELRPSGPIHSILARATLTP
jgi:2'-5' RNA ligase